MTKKRLSDLVREEVDRESKGTDEVPVSPATETPAPPTEEISPPPKSPARRSRLTKAQLEEELKEVTAALELAHQRENSLKNQVQALELELESQKDRIETLESQLEQGTQLEKALEEQKSLVEKLYAELKQAEAVESELAEQKQLVEKLYAELKQAQQKEKDSQADSTEGKLMWKKKLPMGIAPRPIAPISVPPQPSPKLSNEEIGWFD